MVRHSVFVAQWLERRTGVREVSSSIPLDGKSHILYLIICLLFFMVKFGWYHQLTYKINLVASKYDFTFLYLTCLLTMNRGRGLSRLSVCLSYHAKFKNHQQTFNIIPKFPKFPKIQNFQNIKEIPKIPKLSIKLQNILKIGIKYVLSKCSLISQNFIKDSKICKNSKISN